MEISNDLYGEYKVYEWWHGKIFCHMSSNTMSTWCVYSTKNLTYMLRRWQWWK